MNSTEMVEIPKSLLEQLLSYLPKEESVDVPGNGRWNRDMVEQFRQEIAVYRGAVAAFEYAAHHAGSLVTLDEIEEECGFNRKQIAADLGAASKAARRLFGKVIWPMRAMQSNTGMNYLMPREIASWWQS
jgi:hypothetical protein